MTGRHCVLLLPSRQPRSLVSLHLPMQSLTRLFLQSDRAKAGRGRWTEISEAITRGGDEAVDQAIAAIDPSRPSDDRFAQALASLQTPRPREVSWIVPDVVKTSGRSIEIVDEEFRRFVEAHLAALHTEFLNRRKEGAGD